MSDAEAVRRAVAHLKPGDAVQVHAVKDWASLRRPYRVEIECNRQRFPNPIIRGGLSIAFFIGRSRDRGSAERRAARVLAALRRHQSATE